jgi:hypothetical protein
MLTRLFQLFRRPAVCRDCETDRAERASDLCAWCRRFDAYASDPSRYVRDADAPSMSDAVAALAASPGVRVRTGAVDSVRGRV